MKRALVALLLTPLVAVGAWAQQAATNTAEDPLILQRRLAMVLRQSTKLYEAGEYQAALDRLATFQGPAANDLSFLNLRGAILTKMGRYQEALDLFNAILNTDRNYFPAAFNLGEVQFLSGDVEGSLETFQRMRRRDPRNELVRFKIIICLLKLDRDEEAKKIANGLIPAGSTPAWYYAQAVLARKAGDQKLAQKHLTAARSIYQDANCKLFDESIAPVKL